MPDYYMLLSCAWPALCRDAVVAAMLIPLFLGFEAGSRAAQSAAPAAPTAVAETHPMPQWLRKALDQVPAGVRGNPAAIVQLRIQRSRDERDEGIWTGEDLAHLARFPSLKDLTIGGWGFAQDALRQLKKLQGLERISLLAPLTDEDLKSLASLPALKSLKLWEVARLTEAGMRHLSESKSLEDLEIPYWSDVALVRPLEGMKSLKVLRLPVSPLTEAKVAAIAKLKGPAALDLCLDAPLPGEPADRLLEPLRGMANIEGFSIHWQWPQKDDKDPALAVIESLTNLKRLDLAENNLPDADYVRLAALVNLRELNLAGTRISDAGLARLPPLVHMQKLNLAGALVTDASRNIFKNMPDLRELHLDGAHIGDATVGVLGGLQRLERLALGGNVGSPAAMARLAGLKNLKYLVMSHCIRLNDDALAHVGKITSLEELQICYVVPYAAVTDKGVRFLTGLKNLRKLNLVNCSVSIKATMETLKELKGLEVTFTGERPFQEYETLIVGAEDRRP